MTAAGTSTNSVKGAATTIAGDHPDHKFQVNHDLLYEREFERGAFVSAHLQRLQNGVFTDSKLHTKDQEHLHVSFAAITFTFHPVTSSGPSDHRFESAVIEIVAKSNGLPLRFIKHAPHLAFGRISSSNLKWNFSLGAKVGVSSAPAKAEMCPSIEYERDTVVGTMMKIQGSTRSTQLDIKDGLTNAIAPARIPDTRLVWTLEENTQQKAGIPREFTFVFLMERPVPSSHQLRHPKLEKPRALELKPPTRNHSIISSSICSTPMRERSPHGGSQSEITVEQSVGIEMISEKSDYNFLLNVPEPFSHSNFREPPPPGNGMIDNLRAEATRISQKFHHHNDDLPTINTQSATTPLDTSNSQTQQQIDDHYASVFGDIKFSIAVRPDVAGLNIPKSIFEHHAQHATVRGEVGQKFSAMETDGLLEREDVEVSGLYNFTRLPVRFEELIELPGSTVSTVEPTLPSTYGGKT